MLRIFDRLACLRALLGEIELVMIALARMLLLEKWNCCSDNQQIAHSHSLHRCSNLRYATVLSLKLTEKSPINEYSVQTIKHSVHVPIHWEFNRCTAHQKEYRVYKEYKLRPTIYMPTNMVRG